MFLEYNCMLIYNDVRNNVVHLVADWREMG